MAAGPGGIVVLHVEILPGQVRIIDRTDGRVLADLAQGVVQSWDNETLGAVVRSLVEKLSFEWRRR